MSAQTRQMIGSLLVAVAIVAVTIAAVTAKFGPTSAAELEAREELGAAVAAALKSRS